MIEGDHRLIVCHYDILYAWSDYLVGRVVTVIADEGHFLQSDKSRRSLAMRAVMDSAKYRIVATATPMTSRPRDLWNVVDTICPGRFGKFFAFGVRYANGYKEQVTPTKAVWDFSGSSNLPELQHRLKSFMIRRTKSEVALQLPPRTRQVIAVDVDKKYRTAVESALRNNASLRKALDTAADGKIEGIVDLVTNHTENGSKVVCWTYRKVVAEDIAAGLLAQGVKDVAFTHGGIPLAKRQAIVAEQPSVLCATMDAMGAGIDLSYADVGVFAELHWVPSTLIQAEGRQHRFGAARNVLFQYIVANGTADDIIKRGVIAKLDNFDDAIGGSDDGLKKSLQAERMEGVDQLKEFYKTLVAESV
jgi:SNF2 family DNA or RNA helicase